MNVIKMTDINDNKVMVERQEIFMALFCEGDSLVKANFFWPKYKEMINQFLQDMAVLQKEAAEEWAEYEIRNQAAQVRMAISAHPEL